MAITGLRMMTSFCVYGVNYRDTSIAALIGLYKAGCKLGRELKCVVYENNDYKDAFFLSLPNSNSLSLEMLTQDLMSERIYALCRKLPQNTLISTSVLAPFSSGEEQISLSVRPIDNLSHTLILGGNYDTLVEMQSFIIAEQNMQIYYGLGKYVYQEIRPIYGLQDPYVPITGLEELVVTRAIPPLDWAFYGCVLTNMLMLHMSSCLISAKIVDRLSDGGIFFAFTDWRDITTDPSTSLLTRELREQIRIYCDWYRVIHEYTIYK